MQLVNVELPTGELEFVGQPVHSDDPVDALYPPDTQAAQLSVSGPEKPALQVQIELPSDEWEFDGQEMHVEFAEAPTAAEYVPAPQSVQVAFPVKVLYFPAAHAAHGFPFGPVDPALQVQSVIAELELAE